LSVILPTPLRWLIVLIVLLGQSAFWVYCFNRINATGLLRTTIKKFEKLFVIACFLTPILVFGIDFHFLSRWLIVTPDVNQTRPEFFPLASLVLAIFSLGSLIALAPGWLLARPCFQAPLTEIEKLSSITLNVRDMTDGRVFAKDWVRTVGYIPGNELHLLDVNQYQWKSAERWSGLQGLRIGHLSDLHLTGYMHREFYRTAIDQLMSLEPDMLVFSGDLIDFDACLPNVAPLLESVKPRLGAFYVLGNHDRRIQRVHELRETLREIGWHDLGSRSATVDWLGNEIWLVGNERPWFNSLEREADEIAMAANRSLAALRIGVSHAPDQLRWAQSLNCDLLFCGHTHGGQVRLPVIGPIIAPSWYGSKFASGWFREKDTWMHVSRGLSGTHPFRFNCRPEVSLCVL
jgi:uncharacterized protein